LAQVLAPGHERYPRLSFDASAVCSGVGTCAGCQLAGASSATTSRWLAT